MTELDLAPGDIVEIGKKTTFRTNRGKNITIQVTKIEREKKGRDWGDRYFIIGNDEDCKRKSFAVNDTEYRLHAP